MPRRSENTRLMPLENDAGYFEVSCFDLTERYGPGRVCAGDDLSSDCRNPRGTAYVDWLIAIIDGELEKPPTKPVASLKLIA